MACVRVNKPEFKLELIEECIHTLCDEYGIADDQRPKPMGVTDADTVMFDLFSPSLWVLFALMTHQSELLPWLISHYSHES
ncbi:hypothetical protein FOZ62_018675 [Perkinsus olseni]|uniref:Uncharacterized protein n=1 Tax=Perkinsus olseni TaxID=32597 RepID=A0A7J6R2Q0_PEROL|nr:hypothetical protein FOZ62_018675 [Perkinsus olseni]